jgi:hypothetical protein
VPSADGIAPLSSEEPGHPVEESDAALPVEFSPRVWRYLLGNAIFYVGVMCIFLAVRSGRTRPFWSSASLIAGGFGLCLVLLGSLWHLPRQAIFVEDKEVRGPSVWSAGPTMVTILLTDIDRIRSARRRFVDRLRGRQYLWAVDGRRIRLERWSFARADARRLLDLLGIGQSSDS